VYSPFSPVEDKRQLGLFTVSVTLSKDLKPIITEVSSDPLLYGMKLFDSEGYLNAFLNLGMASSDSIPQGFIQIL
jgi:hypothetical protein